MAARRITLLTPLRDFENMDIGMRAPNPSALKDVMASGRTHRMPKRVFGELKNLLFNQEQNSTVNEKSCEPAESQSKTESEFDDIDFCSFSRHDTIVDSTIAWAEKVVPTSEERNRILKPLRSRTEPITVKEINDIIEMEFGKEDLFGDLIGELEDVSDENRDDIPQLPAFDF